MNFQSTNQLGGYKIVGLHFVFMGTWVVVTDNVYLIHKDWLEKDSSVTPSEVTSLFPQVTVRTLSGVSQT